MKKHRYNCLSYGMSSQSNWKIIVAHMFGSLKVQIEEFAWRDFHFCFYNKMPSMIVHFMWSQQPVFIFTRPFLFYCSGQTGSNGELHVPWLLLSALFLKATTSPPVFGNLLFSVTGERGWDSGNMGLTARGREGLSRKGYPVSLHVSDIALPKY